MLGGIVLLQSARSNSNETHSVAVGYGILFGNYGRLSNPRNPRNPCNPCYTLSAQKTHMHITSLISEHAHELGFPAVGVAAVEPMDPAPLRAWLAAGYGAEMAYLHRHLPLRADLTAVLPGARSVICVALPYAGPVNGETAVGAVACYARGEDYHRVVAERLQQLWVRIQAMVPDAVGRIFVDSGPLPERELARRAGVGWVGRHSCLISPLLGSRFVLGEILTTLALPASTPLEGSCGDCRRCRDACPTGALQETGMVDARRCLSYLTIEHRGAIPRALRPLLGTRLFGCDACQHACPHNQQLGDISTPLIPRAELIAPDLPTLLALSPAEFAQGFRHTALQRAKRVGLLRNACVALGNLGDPAHHTVLAAALRDPEPLIRAHAAWAQGRLGDERLLRAALVEATDGGVREEITAALQ